MPSLTLLNKIDGVFTIFSGFVKSRASGLPEPSPFIPWQAAHLLSYIFLPLSALSLSAQNVQAYATTSHLSDNERLPNPGIAVPGTPSDTASKNKDEFLFIIVFWSVKSGAPLKTDPSPFIPWHPAQFMS